MFVDWWKPTSCSHNPRPGVHCADCLGLFFCLMLLVTLEEGHWAPVAFLWEQKGDVQPYQRGSLSSVPVLMLEADFSLPLAAWQAVLLQQVASPCLPCCWRQDQPTGPPFKPLTSPLGPPHLPLCFHYCCSADARALLAPPTAPHWLSRRGLPGSRLQRGGCKKLLLQALSRAWCHCSWDRTSQKCGAADTQWWRRGGDWLVNNRRWEQTGGFSSFAPLQGTAWEPSASTHSLQGCPMCSEQLGCFSGKVWMAWHTRLWPAASLLLPHSLGPFTSASLEYVLSKGVCAHGCVHSLVSNSETPSTVAHQAPLSMGFSRQEYWSGLPFPSPGDLPDPGTEPGSSALTHRFFKAEPPGKSKQSFST